MGRSRGQGKSLIDISRRLSEDVDRLTFQAPVAYVYNPLSYAAQIHDAFLKRFGSGTKRWLLVGMNPGPWGMVQTGVPFGDPAMVRDWMGLSGTVRRPTSEHPKRPVLGLDSPRKEVSGTRLWTWVEARWGAAEKFFDEAFVLNHCPLAFLEEGGRNRTPDKLPLHERKPLIATCDLALRETVRLLNPQWVVGVGAFAETQARSALEGLDVSIGRVLHPSPASPAANRGWGPQATAQLRALGLSIPDPRV